MASKGKGIEALIPKKVIDPAQSKKTAASVSAEEGVFSVEISSVEASEEQPRKHFVKGALDELAQSIRNHGILQPLVVEKFEKETPSGVDVKYHLLAGERRLRAAKIVGLKIVPVVVRKASDDRTRLLISLIENVQREDLNAIERAEAYQRLKSDFNLSQDEVAQRIGKSRESIANTLRLLNLSDIIQKALKEGELSEGHGRALLAAPENKRDELFAQMRVRSMSVREAEALARSAQKAENVPTRRADPKRAETEEKLKEKLGVPVRITHRGNKGSISIPFSSEKEMEKLVKRLVGEE